MHRKELHLSHERLDPVTTTRVGVPLAPNAGSQLKRAHSSCVRDGANYLLMSSASMEEERREANEALERLRGKRDEPKPAADKKDESQVVPKPTAVRR